MKIVGFLPFRPRYPSALLGLLMGASVSVGAVYAADQAAPELGLPIDCRIGETCWLVNLVDLDSSPGIRDFRCKDHSYDGHKGVDIAIRDLKAMQDGVAVVAAAPGVVRAVRDGMADKMPDADFRKNAKDRYCGNGLVMVHGGGWESQYCHLRRGSVRVKPGQKIRRGQELGMVGHSGMAEFPHVHFTVRRAGKVIDPFLGSLSATAAKPSCGAGARPLWQKAAKRILDGPMTAIYNAGFAAERPKTRAVRAGLYKAKALSRRSPVLVFWVDIWWIRPGDKLELRIFGPDGKVVVEHASQLPKKQARRMVFAGRKKKGLFWPSGTYAGVARLTRVVDGKTQVFETRRRIVIKD